MRHRLLLDTSSLAYRAFHALPTSITDPDGHPVNAVRGYLDMVSRLRQDRAPDEVVHVLDDAERPAARVAAWPEYKAQRSAIPEELPPQFDLLDDVLAAAGERRARAAGWEADDAIAACCVAADADDLVEIVTGDRDLLQLVDDGGPTVRVLLTRRGVSQLDELDEAGVAAAHGVAPRRYVDYAILRGDPSDGLPGVAGVGERTASDLVARYDDLDALVADAAALSPRLGERIAAAGPYFSAMLEVVPVRADVPVEVRGGGGDPDALDVLAAERGLEGPVGRLRAARREGRP